MSHYNVAVIIPNGGDLSEMLAPYDENLDVEKAVYMEKEEVLTYASELKEKYENVKNKEEIPEDISQLLLAKTEEEIIHAYAKVEGTSEDMIREDGAFLYWHNPNAKWDWWAIGGRWRNFLRTKDGILCDCAKIKNIDFSLDEKKYQYASRLWEVVVDGEPLRDGEKEEDFNCFMSKEWMRKRYLNKETYAKAMADFNCFAVVNEDGWHEKGEMGWFGISSETHEEAREWDNSFYDTFIKNANPEDNIVIVDCHI